MSKAQLKRPSPPSTSEPGRGRKFLIASTLVAIVFGGVGFAWRVRNEVAPTTSSATAAILAPVNAPLPAMSQAAPANSRPQVHGNATGVPAASYQGGPRLVADYSRLDFGAIDYRELVDAEFTVTNVGDAPLTIEDVSVQTIFGC